MLIDAGISNPPSAAPAGPSAAARSMVHDVIATCPVCAGELTVTRLHCRSCGTALEGEFGVDGLFVGVPVVLGRGGLERVFEITLTPDERVAFYASDAAVKELVDKLPA